MFREDFETLDDWTPLAFKNIQRQTTYTIENQAGDRILAARSSSSASALIHRQTFDITEYPIIRWRWKVERVYESGDYRTKSGDDYPLRIYVLFDYDPATAATGDNIRFELGKAIFGRYPPRYCLNYIWANRPHETEAVPSPYTSRSVMIPLEQGPENVGRWMEETVNVLEDFKRVFGENPPREATLAIMNDSDNTGEQAASYLAFIEVRK